MQGEPKCGHEYRVDQFRREDRKDVRNLGYDTTIVIFDTISSMFFGGIENSFDSNSGPIKYNIKYRHYDNKYPRHIYSDETGIVSCKSHIDEEVNAVNIIFFKGDEGITTRIFEEFKKFASEQKLEEVIFEALKYLPPRRLTKSEYPYEELKKFADKHNIRYKEEIELR